MSSTETQSREDQSIPTRTLSAYPSPRGTRQGFLHITPGDRLFPLKGNEITIGSAASNTLPISDPAISRVHCLLKRSGRRWWVLDRKSKNGVFVNGSKIREVELGGGDAIHIGNTTLRFTSSKGVFPNLYKVRKCGDMVAQSPAMLEVFKQIEMLAETNLSVMILGESGTGKELVADVFHKMSYRSDKSFIPINCGALPPDLLEAELFGYEKGAFTGADKAKSGVFESANGGTLFLDEIGELPLPQQPALLRVLDSGKIRRLGSNRLRSSNARIICATNQNLKSLMHLGLFRSDLYYRLAECMISLPPLRERPSDIPILIQHFLKTLPYTKRAEFPSRWVLDKLMKHDWPGNIRELRNLVRRSSVLGWEQAAEKAFKENPFRQKSSADGWKSPEPSPTKAINDPSGDISDDALQYVESRAKQPEPEYNAEYQPDDPLQRTESLNAMERTMLAKALETTKGNQSKAASLLKMKRTTFRLKLKKHRMI